MSETVLPKKGGTTVKRILAIVISGALLVGLVLVPSIAAGAELEVGPGEDYSTISDALEDANNGDTIIVYENGVYEENIEVTKSVTIEAAEDEEPIVDGGTEPAFVLIANGVTLQGICVYSSGEESAGIVMYSAQCLISENQIRGDDIVGILLDNGAHHNHILNNEIEDTSAGIILEPGCHHNNIQANGIFNVTDFGILMSDNLHNIVFENTVEAENEYEERYAIVTNEGSSNNTIIENRVFGGWTQGISLYMECSNNLVMDNVFGGDFEDSAINIECSSDNEIIENLIAGPCGWNGISIYGCCADEENCPEEENGEEVPMILAVDNLVEGNVVDIEGESAIWADDTAVGTTISGNSITGSYYGGDPWGAAINVQDYSLIVGNLVLAECGIGIHVKNFNQVLQNEVAGCERGIVIGPDEGNLISENLVHYNWEGGIWLELSFDNAVENNIVVSNGTGILLLGAYDNEIINNTVYNSECHGIAAEGTNGDNAENNIIQNNTAFFNGDGEECFDLYDDDHPEPGIDNIWEPNIWDTKNFEEED